MKTLSNTYKIKLGIFVTFGILILFIIIFFIGNNQNLFSSKFKVNTNFRNVSGLQVGGQVRFSGISVGTIENIAIVNDTTVKVTAVLNNDVKEFIKKDSEASITSAGVIGDKILMISQGNVDSPAVSDGATIPSKEPVEFENILSSISVSAQNAEIITDELAMILVGINEGQGTIGKLLNDDGVAEDLEKTIENLNKGTKGLEQNMEAAKNNFLLRGYFRKQEREKEKARKEAEKEAEKAAKDANEKAKHIK